MKIRADKLVCSYTKTGGFERKLGFITASFDTDVPARPISR